MGGGRPLPRKYMENFDGLEAQTFLHVVKITHSENQIIGAPAALFVIVFFCLL